MALCVAASHWFIGRRSPQVATGPVNAPTEAPLWVSPTQKRQSFRRDGNPTRIQVAPAGDTSNPAIGYVLDRSTGGLGMSVDQEVAPGTILSVRPASGPDVTPWYDVEVLRCKHDGEAWHLSCKFVKTPPYSILLLFG